jgi:formate C-acetyltransferase
MEEVCKALDSDWNGFEGLRAQILKRAKFFGNDEEISNTIAKRLMGILVKWNDGNNYLGKKWIFGNLIGYNEHNKFFGEKMNATPDGRRKGEQITFGIGQSEGKDRNGLTSLLNSIACCDPEAILTGPSVTNVMIDENLIKNDDYFEKLVSLFEAYFIKGGTHFQLSYVSKEDLIAAKEAPEKHRHIRVRVSGFSDYFVNLNNALQDEIIKRTKY